MPVLFVGHGNPMYTLSDNEFTREWQLLAKKLPKPKAVLCISAHWETNGTSVTIKDKPETIHDFGGFPSELYEVEYPAPGSPELANNVIKLAKKYNVKAENNWGFDHGCWCVLRHLFPDADVPVVQLSIDYNKSFKEHSELAKELSELRKQDVLIICSGNIVHNLRLVVWGDENAALDWAVRFNNNIKKIIMKDDFGTLLDIKSLDKDFITAAPSTEHFIPLIYAMSLKDETDKIKFFNDKIVMGSLSMTSVLIES